MPIGSSVKASPKALSRSRSCQARCRCSSCRLAFILLFVVAPAAASVRSAAARSGSLKCGPAKVFSTPAALRRVENAFLIDLLDKMVPAALLAGLRQRDGLADRGPTRRRSAGSATAGPAMSTGLSHWCPRNRKSPVCDRCGTIAGTGSGPGFAPGLRSTMVATFRLAGQPVQGPDTLFQLPLLPRCFFAGAKPTPSSLCDCIWLSSWHRLAGARP